ncbi:MAG: AAA family ATPase [Gammaproteobacteria bacterium]
MKDLRIRFGQYACVSPSADCSFPDLPELRQLICPGEIPFEKLISPSVQVLTLSTLDKQFLEKINTPQLAGIRHLSIDDHCRLGHDAPDDHGKSLLPMLPAELKTLRFRIEEGSTKEIEAQLSRFQLERKQINISRDIDKLSPEPPRSAPADGQQGDYRQTTEGSPESGIYIDRRSPEPPRSAPAGGQKRGVLSALWQRINKMRKKTDEKKPTHANAFTPDHRPTLGETKLDADTEDQPLHSSETAILFKTKDRALDDPRLYRLKVYTGLDKDLEPYTEFGKWREVKVTHTRHLEEQFDAKTDRNLAFSSMVLTNTPGKQVLYSLSPNEKLTEVEIISDDKNAIVTFHYDSKTRLYSAEVKASAPVQLNYVLEVNRKKYTGTEKMDASYKKMVANYSDPVFRTGKLKLATPLKGRALLKKIREQRKGSCRHRSIGCLDDSLQTEVKEHRMLMSGSSNHAFVEIITPEGGITVDLGGGEVGQRKTLPFNPKSLPQAAVIDQPKPKIFAEAEFKQLERPPLELSDNSKEEFLADLFKLKKPVFLQTQSHAQLESLEMAAARYARESKTEYCYIDDLDQLKSAETRAFINNARDKKADVVMILRWDKSKIIRPEHVGLNSLFDKTPRLEGEPLPGNLRIIAIAEKSSGMGDDVRSRFQRRIYPVPEKLVLPANEEVRQASEQKTEAKDAEVINLYDSPEWKKLLVGRPTWFNGKEGFIEGKLLQALKPPPKKILNVINAPWHLPEFNVFWNKLHNERRFFAEGKFHDLPADFALTWTTVPYARPEHVAIQPLDEKNIQGPKLFLNQKTFKRFFAIISEKGGLTEQLPGLFEKHQHSKLTLVITETLTGGQWAQLFDKAKDHGCELTVLVTPGVEMPEHLKPEEEVKPVDFLRKDNHVSIVTSNDAGFVAKSHPDHVVLDVSPDTGYGLVDHWVGVKSADGKRVDYINEEGALIKLLKAGTNVTLTGKLSDRLASRLQTLFSDPPYLEYNGQELQFGKELKGKLQIVTRDNAFLFVNVPHIKVDLEKYWELVSVDDRKYRDLITKLCAQLNVEISFFSQLESILQNLKQHPEKNPVEWLLLLKDHPEELLKRGQEIYEKLNPHAPRIASEEKVADELEVRMREMDARLSKTPFLFLIGPSGTGKSTTVLQELDDFYDKRGKKVRIFVTTPPMLENITEWAKCNEGDEKTMKFLFIDEANLSPEDSFAFAQGMAKKPPEITYKDERIILSENHKIVFAGNYQHYQNRELHELFLKQDCVQHFPAFSPEYVNRKQVLPLIEAALQKGKSAEISSQMVLDIFLSAMKEAKSIKPEANLTTRNLQSMALAFDVLWNKKNLLPDIEPQIRIEKIAKWAFYQNARDALGPEKAEDLQLHLFGTEYHDLKKKFPDRVVREEMGSMQIASVHKRAVAVLQEEMHIRDLRCRTKALGLASGTCGTLIGGVPGIGKSETAINVLKKLGFTEADEKTAEDGAKKYYHITLTNPQKMKEKLLKAFHEGAVVVIDEINTLPVESLLNSLMMGVDDKGKKAKWKEKLVGEDDKGKAEVAKGFYVIGTYNPIGSGRHTLSPAAENRFRKVEMPDYSELDMEKFLAQKFPLVPENVREYFNNKYQQAKDSENPYSLRDLLDDIEHTQSKPMPVGLFVKVPQQAPSSVIVASRFDQKVGPPGKG